MGLGVNSWTVTVDYGVNECIDGLFGLGIELNFLQAKACRKHIEIFPYCVSGAQEIVQHEPRLPTRFHLGPLQIAFDEVA